MLCGCHRQAVEIGVGGRMGAFYIGQGVSCVCVCYIQDKLALKIVPNMLFSI